MQTIADLHEKLFELLNDFDSFCKENGIQYFLAYGSVLGAIRHKDFIPWDDDLDVMMTRENYNKLLSAYKNNEKYFLQRDTIDYPLQFSKLRANETTFIERIPYKRKYKNIHQGMYIDIFPVDKVAAQKHCAMLQVFFSRILISQSLALRGYHTQVVSKKIALALSYLFLPFRKFMLGYIVKFNTAADFEYYNCFCDVKKIYLDKSMLEHGELVEFRNKAYPVPSNPTEYLKRVYNNWNELPAKEERQAKVHAAFFSTTEDYTKHLEQ